MRQRLTEAIQIFDEVEALVAGFWEFQFPAVTPTWSPATDVFVSRDEVCIRVEVPGVARKDLKIAVSPVVLEISGFRPTPESFRRGTSFYELEIPYGVFRKRVALPCRVVPKEIRAVLVDGLLTVCLPKLAGSGREHGPASGLRSRQSGARTADSEAKKGDDND
jgi:HSP20 family protein